MSTDGKRSWRAKVSIILHPSTTWSTFSWPCYVQVGMHWFPYFSIHVVLPNRHNGFQGSRQSNESLFGGNGWKSIGTKLAEMEKRSGRIDLSREDRGQPCMHVRRNPLTRILSMEFRCYFVWNSSRADRITFFRGNRNRSTYWPFLIPAEWRRSKNGSCRWLESKWKRSGLEWGFEGRVRAITYGRITENLTDVVRREREIRIRVSLSPDFSGVSQVLIKTV